MLEAFEFVEIDNAKANAIIGGSANSLERGL
jgi:hypothetical protein